ncbi:MAG: hypothetical protein HKL90_10525 [Elusimicrobia bacterium]|nr:hypothetical protein [Elusimicrobiota bacterium]
MSRSDLLVLSFWCAAVLALLSPVWARPDAVFFNHGDLFTYHVPLRSLTAAALQSGRLPFWNPYILLGLPHAANPQAALFYPPALLGVFFPIARALTWDQVFHLLWAGIGMFLLARAQRLDRAGAAILASSFALSPLLIYRVTAGIPTLLAALAWIPWLWLFWLSGMTALLMGAIALQLLSGHAQFLLINAVGMGLWALARADRGKLLKELSLAGAGGAALTALQWILTAQFLRLSVRSNWQGASDLYTMRPANLSSWIFPGALGTPLDGRWSGAVSEFYETCVGNVGLVALALAAVGLVRGRRRGPAFAAGLFGLGLAFGPRFAPARLLSSLPPLSYLRTPARWLLLPVWSVLLLAGAGLDSLRGARLSRGARAFAAPAAFLLLAAWGVRFLRPQDPTTFLAPHAETAERFGGRPMRVLTDPVLANPNKAALYRMRNVNGYEAFYLSGVPAWAAAAQGGAAADASRVYVSRWPSPVLARAGVVARLGPAGVDWAKAWPMAAFVNAAGVRLEEPLKVFAERPGLWRAVGFVPPGAAALELSEPAYPGWRAWRDGSPAGLSSWDGLFQKVRVPASEIGRKIAFTFEFEPTGWALLACAAAAAWAAWLALLFARAEAE